MLNVPENVPAFGFYYHYKHKARDPFNSYAYEVVDIGFHTETGEAMVIYRPLYPEAPVYKAGKRKNIRPLAMFMENVTKRGKTVPRFEKIINPELIGKLERMKRQMYGVGN